MDVQTINAIFYNAALDLDGYKTDHRRQYPDFTQYVHSNLTARNSKYATVPKEIHEDKVVFFGLSYYIQEFLIKRWNENFFNRDVEEVVDDYNEDNLCYLGPNDIGDQHIRDLHEYGRLPLRIKALPEGVRVPIQVPPVIVESLNEEVGKKFFWLTNSIESYFSSTIWGPMTSATTAHGYRAIIEKYAEETGGSMDFVPIQGHDFSARGMYGYEASQMSGAAHLLSFVGTDTRPAIGFLRKYYGAERTKEVIGISVPATEHAVMCMGTKDGEESTMRRLMNTVYPNGIISIVSDTWDWWNTVTVTVPNMKDDILARDGKVVLRPDSGDPVRIVCGYHVVDNAENDDECEIAENGQYITKSGSVLQECEVKGAVQCLWDTFGGTVNEKGFKTLDPHIGLIYGDGINFNNCQAILEGMKRKGFASDNCVFGFGSFGYQMVTRDTFGMAVKATFGIVDGEERAIFKDPKTGSGKKSAKGLLVVLKDSQGEYYLREEVPYSEYKNGVDGDQMDVVFEDGEHLIKPTLKEIRNRLWDGFGEFSLG